MTPPLFGYVPPDGALDSAAGCDGVLKQVGMRKGTIHSAMQTRPLTERETYINEIARLDALKRDVILRREYLLNIASGEHERFDKTFRRVVQQHVGEATFRAWIAEAHALIAASNAQPSTASHGPAIEPRGGGGGVRTRRLS